MIKAEWTSNDALSTGQTTHSNAHNTLNALDCVSRQYAIEHYQHVCRRTTCKECPLHIQVTDTLTDCELELFLHNLPSAQPEIIRCRDCKHRHLDGMIWNCPFGLSGGADFFCAYGAKMEVEHDSNIHAE